MDTALVTGMLQFGYNVKNTLSRDVSKSKDSNFQEIFSKNIEKEKGIQDKKENTKDVKEIKNKDVENKDEKLKNKDKIDNKSDEKIDKTEDKKENKNEKTEDKEEKIEDKVNGLIVKILEDVKEEGLDKLEDVLDIEDVELEDLEKIMDVDLLKKFEELGLSKEETLKLQETIKEKLMQRVVEVGPQNVETEKITLNKYDELEEKLEVLENKLEGNSKLKNEDVNAENLIQGESTEKNSFDLSSTYENREFENKDGENKEDKITIKDFTNKQDNNILNKLDGEIGKIDSNFMDVKSTSVSSTILNKAVDMQEQIDVIKQISEKVDVNLFEDKSEMIIKLKPDHLGKVTVEVAVENGNITAKFLAESEKVKEILESNMQDLKDHLAKQGMVIQDLSVSVGNDNRDSLFGQNNYDVLKKRRRIEGVNNNEAFIEDDYGINELKEAYYWPDSTVSFSA